MKYPEDFINKIICGDCLEVMREIPNSSINLIIADPPFNQGKKYDFYEDKLELESYLKFSELWIDEAYRILEENGAIFIMNRQEIIGNIQVILNKKYIFRNFIIWAPGMASQKNRFIKSWQGILFYVKGPGDNYFNIDSERLPHKKHWGCKEEFKDSRGRRIDDIWGDIPKIVAGCQASKEAILLPGSFKKEHPCQMPLKLAARIIKATTKENDIVLDPFIGSGTTARATKDLKRNYIGIDISLNYCEMSIDRLAQGVL